MIEYYTKYLKHKDMYLYKTFVKYYQHGNKRDKKRYLYVVTRDAQNEKYTYREVLKLISIGGTI